MTEQPKIRTMIPKWLYCLLNAAAYPPAIFLACRLSALSAPANTPQGMGGGLEALYYAIAAVLICFIISLFASYKLVGSCWPAVIVFIGFLVVFFL